MLRQLCDYITMNNLRKPCVGVSIWIWWNTQMPSRDGKIGYCIKMTKWWDDLPLLQLKTNVLQWKIFLLFEVCSNIHRPISQNILPINTHFFLLPFTHWLMPIVQNMCRFVVVGMELLLPDLFKWAWVYHVYFPPLWPCMDALCWPTKHGTLLWWARQSRNVPLNIPKTQTP